MLLKKQTVWLLTMLSLVVVLSVYYITSPEQKATNMANVEEKAKEKKSADTTTSDDGKTVISGVASDEVFEALRLELEDQRNEMKEQLNEIMASTDLSAEKRSEAYDQMKSLDELAKKENVLETLIKTMGYDDALVRADGEKVRITVKSKDHSASAANDIIQLVRTEIGELENVVVDFQPTK
ncbi:SpoIIIAH-like family protein [Bacillus marasmi]|uniref:SpoIIIAH-like family protein n=1 Tax=Bacillus marasmi TaxID=1926279 RepID=UPI0011C8845C|nr:SpoIIIAH-like family protein [Bacillus marasmi]